MSKIEYTELSNKEAIVMLSTNPEDVMQSFSSTYIVSDNEDTLNKEVIKVDSEKHCLFTSENLYITPEGERIVVIGMDYELATTKDLDSIFIEYFAFALSNASSCLRVMMTKNSAGKCVVIDVPIDEFILTSDREVIREAATNYSTMLSDSISKILKSDDLKSDDTHSFTNEKYKFTLGYKVATIPLDEDKIVFIMDKVNSSIDIERISR